MSAVVPTRRTTNYLSLFHRQTPKIYLEVSHLDWLCCHSQVLQCPLFHHSRRSRLPAKVSPKPRSCQKRIRNDATHFTALNHVHAHTYDGSRGMCLDINLYDTAGALSESLQDALHVEYLTLGEEEGNVFDGFEAAWRENGGRVGGWNN